MLSKIIQFFEKLAYSRAANELYRQGYYKEANRLSELSNTVK
jgi:hypothetical protein